MKKGRSRAGIIAIVIFTLGFLSVCPLFGQMGATPTPMNSQSSGSITISGYWARMALQVGGVSAAYMEIRSAEQADTLVRAESPVAKVVELHETTMREGLMAMSPVAKMTVPAKGEVLVLKPAGLHLMLIDLKSPLKAGDVFGLDLYFDRTGKITLNVPVLAP